MTPDVPLQKVVPSDVVQILRDIYLEWEKQEFADLNFSVRTHHRLPVSLITDVFKLSKYPQTGDNSQAATDILSLLKSLEGMKKTGEFTFTIVLNEGIVRKIIEQGRDYKKYGLTNNESM